MKKIFVSLLLVCIFLLACDKEQNNQEKIVSQNYYWYQGSKINLDSDSSVFYLEYAKTSDAPQLIRTAIAAAFKIHDTAIHQLSDTQFIIKSATKIAASAFTSQPANLKYTAPLLTTKNAIMIVLPHIVVQLKEGHSIEEVINLYKNNLTVLKNRGFNTYILQSNSKSSKEVLDISNALYEKSGNVIWSEPEFYTNYKLF